MALYILTFTRGKGRMVGPGGILEGEAELEMGDQGHCYDLEIGAVSALLRS